MSKPEHAYVLTIGRKNCELVLGMSWASTRRLARELGVGEMRITDRLVLIDAQALLAALRERAAREEAARAPLTDEEERNQMRAALGMELRPTKGRAPDA